MEIVGIIKVIGDTQTISDRFKKREIVITTESTSPYPQHIPCQMTQDKTSMLDNFKVGDEVKAQFNLRGREFQGANGLQHFLTIELWRIEKVGSSSQPTVNNSPPAFTGNHSEEDLPF